MVEVSRRLGVEAPRLAAWRDELLAAGKVGLKGRMPAGVAAELARPDCDSSAGR